MQTFGEHSVCLLTQISLCYYINAIFPYQNTNCVGLTFSMLVYFRNIMRRLAVSWQPVCVCSDLDENIENVTSCSGLVGRAGNLDQEIIGSIPGRLIINYMLAKFVQLHTLFGSQVSEQKSQTGPQYILGFIQKTQSSPRHVAGKKPKQFRSITLCRIYTPQYISGKLGEFRTVWCTCREIIDRYRRFRVMSCSGNSCSLQR